MSARARIREQILEIFLNISSAIILQRVFFRTYTVLNYGNVPLNLEHFELLTNACGYGMDGNLSLFFPGMQNLQERCPSVHNANTRDFCEKMFWSIFVKLDVKIAENGARVPL